MTKVTVEELFERSLLSIPKTAKELSIVQLGRGERFENRGGVYTFYNCFNEPLYVGISDNVSKRVKAHINGTGNVDVARCILSGKDVIIKVFYVDSKAYQEVYESYLIKQLDPRYNVAKTGRAKLG